MTKIAFLISSLNMGGTEKALLSMLNSMDRSKLSITIFLLEEKGELLKDVPSDVKIKTIEGYDKVASYVHNNIYTVFKNELARGKIIRAVSLGLAYCMAKIKNDCCIYYKSFSGGIRTSEEMFDLVAAYQGPMNYLTYLADKKFCAKKRAAWIHFDIAHMGYTNAGASRIYNNIDRIFAVSECAKQRFIEAFPECEKKTSVFLNILPREKILQMGEERVPECIDKKTINLLTIGRISYQKGQDMIPEIVHGLRERGYNVKWYLIGGVEQCDSNNPMQILQRKMKQFKVEDNIVWLGVKQNPYPYLKQCDIYVQPSRYEGYCTTTNEAKLFGIPIITTNVSGATEQFVSEENGLICEIEISEVLYAIERVISDQKLRDKLTNNLFKEEVKTREDPFKEICLSLKIYEEENCNCNEANDNWRR